MNNLKSKTWFSQEQKELLKWNKNISVVSQMRSFRLKNQTSKDVAVATLQVSKAQRLRLMKKKLSE